MIDTVSITKLKAAARGDVLHTGRGRDLVTGDHELLPLELLSAVHHAPEVDADVGVQERREDRHAAVDGGEHRRRHEVSEPGRARGLYVQIDRIALDGLGVLADLLPAHRVQRGGVHLGERGGVHRHAIA